jgi:flagellar basal body-associated protein FliL
MPRKNWLSIILVIVILLSSVGVVFVNVFGVSSTGDGSRGSSRAIYWNATDITTKESYVVDEIFMNGNLTIKAGGVLDLKFTNLTMNYTGTSQYAFKIEVQDNGILKAGNDSIINKNEAQTGSNYELIFLPGSSGTINDSEISNCGILSQEGIFVNDAETHFTNSVLDSNYNGISYYDSIIDMEDCSISNAESNGVYCNNSTGEIINTEITDAGDYDLYLEKDSNVSIISTSVMEVSVMDTSKLYIYWLLTVEVLNDTADAIENAKVEVFDKNAELVFTGKTDENGKVKDIKCLERIKDSSTTDNIIKTHIIKVTADDYFSEEKEVDMESDKTEFIYLEEKPETGTIEGYVKDELGDPVTEANVSIIVEGKIISDDTDDAGRYELKNIAVGDNYSVSAEGKINNISAYEFEKIDSVIVVVDSTTVVNFTLIEKPLPVSVEVESWDEPVNAESAKAVDIDTPITITFGVAMNNTTVNSNTVQLKLGGRNVPLSISEVDPEIDQKYTATIVGEKLELGRTYTLQITKGVQRFINGQSLPVLWQDYIISFETHINPVLEINPPDLSISVDTINPDIYVLFQNTVELDVAGLENSFKLLIGSSSVPGTIDFLTLENKAYFIPSEELESETEYTVVLADDLRNKTNEFVIPTRESILWTFTTKKTTTEIMGTILDENDKPLKGATIKLEHEDGSNYGPIKTDSEGKFKLTDMKTGKYNITIEASGYEPIKKQLVAGVTTPINTSFPLEKKSDAGFEMDPMLLMIIIIIIIIIIIVIIALAMRKPKPEEEYGEEEYAEEERVARVPARAQMRPAAAAEPRPTYRATVSRGAVDRIEEPARRAPQMPSMCAQAHSSW